MNRKAMFFSGRDNIYDDAIYIFSLRRFFSFNRAVLKLIRSSDNDQKFIFFDGDTITLSSKVGGTSTTPSATMLGDWIGSDDGHVISWYEQAKSIDISVDSETGARPKFISAGTIITVNGLPSIDFLSTNARLKNTTGFTELNDGNDITITSVSTNNASGGLGAILNNTNTSDIRIVMFNDRTTTGGVYRIGIVKTIDGVFQVTLLAADDTGTQRSVIITLDGTAKEIKGYKNGTFQNSNTWTNTYNNDHFRLGAQHSNLTPLNGHIQEVIIFGVVKDEISALDTDIRSYYGF